MWDFRNPPTGKLRISPRQVSLSILWPEVGNWYLVYHGWPSWNHVWHGLVMGDHMRLSKSSHWNFENFSKAGVIPNSLGGSWSLVLWFIKRTTIYSHTAQAGYGQLHASATNLLFVRNSRVLLTALTALTEPLTLWQSLWRDLSPMPQVLSHTSYVVAIIPWRVFFRRIALNIMSAAPSSGFLYFASGCNGVVKYAWLGLPGGHVRCPAPGNRQRYIDIATET